MTTPQTPSAEDIALFGLKPIPMQYNSPYGSERVNLYHQSSVASLIARIHLLEDRLAFAEGSRAKGNLMLVPADRLKEMQERMASLEQDWRSMREAMEKCEYAAKDQLSYLTDGGEVHTLAEQIEAIARDAQISSISYTDSPTPL